MISESLGRHENAFKPAAGERTGFFNFRQVVLSSPKLTPANTLFGPQERLVIKTRSVLAIRPCRPRAQARCLEKLLRQAMKL
jgi:hypothetical protein